MTMHRPRSAALAAALLLATSGVQPTQAAGLSPADRHILRPSVQAAQVCLSTLARLDADAAFTIDHLNRNLPGSMYLGANAGSAIMACGGAQRYGVDVLRQKYPARARKGRLHLVLTRLARLFAGGVQAGESCLNLDARLGDPVIGEPQASEAREAMADDARRAIAGLEQAQHAAEALHQDISAI